MQFRALLVGDVVGKPGRRALAVKVCRDIAKAVEDELQYPGEVKVVLIREHRVIEYAR